MAEQGQEKLLSSGPIKVQGEDWVPMGLVPRAHPSPVRVTRKGVPKYQARHEARQSVHRGSHRTPPDWWTRTPRQWG